ncbi:MAG TPA: ATP-binding protein [Kofleriaceae bacterium]|nr:ATP-binding protein [Kofleriaceae bacterium]
MRGDAAGRDRPVAWSGSGNLLAAPTVGGVKLLDVRSGAQRVASLPAQSTFRLVMEKLIVTSDDGARVVGLEPDLDQRVLSLAPGEQTAFCATAWGPSVVVSSPSHHRVAVGTGHAQLERLASADRLLAVLPDQSALLATGDEVVMTRAGRPTKLDLPGEVLHIDVVLGGRALAVLSAHAGTPICSVVSSQGELLRRVELPGLVGWTVAALHAFAIMLGEQGELHAIDLRIGRVKWTCQLDLEWSALAVHPRGTSLAGLRPTHEIDILSVAELARSRPAERASPPTQPEPRAAESSPAPGSISALGDTADGTAQPRASASPGLEASAPRPSPPPPLRLPSPAWLMRRPRRRPATPGALPYRDAADHLQAVLALCRARATRAIAHAWSAGRLAFHRDEQFPFEGEVAALAGQPGEVAPSVSQATACVELLYGELVRRTSATLAHGVALPLIDLADEQGLVPSEVHALMTVAAPQLSVDIARLHAIAANSASRGPCDRALLSAVLAADLPDGVAARILAPSAPLVRLGLIEVTPGATWQLDTLSVRPSLLLRLLGEHLAVIAGEHVTVRATTIDPDRFRGPRRAIDRWLAELAELPADAHDVRVVVRGPAGVGRRSLLDAVAARAGRRCGFIDAAHLHAEGSSAAAKLRGAVRDATIAGLWPCIVEPEALGSEPAIVEVVRDILRSHPGPLAIVARPSASLPLGPGAVSLTIPAATASERLETWTDATHRFGLPVQDLVGLATRLPAGPGTIERVCRATAAAVPDADRDCTAELDARCRQHLEHRLGKLATRLHHKPAREDLILPPDLMGTIDELIARVRLRHIVYDRWGFGERSSLRGLTALFYGPPGTGKSMVAGMIAGELGLELYRVDLSAVTSKWLGETEKHLAELFDAAEGGEIVLLFDEADSLFTKRTEVESSHDRHANLQTNYLLQRLDDFTGIALLTTNSDASIDDAFKRRLSFRLQFPFPDADSRAQLWTSHLPDDTPRAPDLDFATLAERYELSGGNIRNCALRAAFLAARDSTPLDQARIIGTIEREFREMGRLSTSGRLT